MPVKTKAKPSKTVQSKNVTKKLDEQATAEKVLSHLAQSLALNGDGAGLSKLQESMQVFGFAIGDPNKTTKEKHPSFALPESDDGALTTTVGGVYGSYIDIEGSAKNELELISRYREMAMHQECDYAIQDIVNESIVNEDTNIPPVTIELENLEGYSDEFKSTLQKEFKAVLQLLNFKRKGQQIFKRWYVDGRLYYHIMINEEKPERGIYELRYIDPRRIKKFRELRTKRAESGAEIVDIVSEYYLYNVKGLQSSDAITGVRISPDAIAYCHSGLVNSGQNLIISWLHKAIKPLNQLRYIEDAVVIYRISRAPERRIFYVDVGNLQGAKAQQYMNNIINTHRNKLVYDANTGAIRDDKKFLSMMEDFWIPRREGSKGTEIDTLKGGENLGKMEDVEYFEKKLYQSLNVPFSRLSGDSGFNMGRSSEINRDEEKFFKFVVSLREQFQELFFILLRTQLLLKGLIAEMDWPEIQEGIYFNFAKNSFYVEASKLELLNSRLASAGQAAQFMGSLFSREYVYKNILMMSDWDIDQINKQIETEKPRATYDQETLVDLQTTLQKRTSEIQIAGQLKLQKAELQNQMALAPPEPKPLKPKGTK